jgi:uncharacterized protein YndB with AHSA1/START domain
MNKAKVQVEMLIRKPVGDVFDAFVNPGTLAKFWLNHASAPLARNARVEWEFMVPGVRDTLTVTEFVSNRVLAWTWSDFSITKLEFHEQDGSSTRLAVTASGFSGPDMEAMLVNNAEGYTIVLCDLKCLLETGRSGNMVRDKAALITAAKGKA